MNYTLQFLMSSLFVTQVITSENLERTFKEVGNTATLVSLNSLDTALLQARLSCNYKWADKPAEDIVKDLIRLGLISEKSVIPSNIYVDGSGEFKAR